MAAPLWVHTLEMVAPDLNHLSLLDAAMVYAEIGLPVLRLIPGSWLPTRNPAGTEPGRGGVHLATTDLATVERLWTDIPDANIGLAMGVVCDAADIDYKSGRAAGWNDAARLRDHGLLRGAFAHQGSPTGGGHLLFAPDPALRPDTGGHWGFHIDLRARGSYIVAAPSYIASKGASYQWVDVSPADYGPTFDWPQVTALLGAAKPSPRATAHQAGAQNTDITALCKAVTGAGVGNRNAMLFWAAKKAVDAGANPHDLMTAALTCGLTDREATATINSAARHTRQAA